MSLLTFTRIPSPCVEAPDALSEVVSTGVPAGAAPSQKGAAPHPLDPAGRAIAVKLGLRFDGFQCWPTGDFWVFTCADPRSPYEGGTIGAAPGSTFTQVARIWEGKKQAYASAKPGNPVTCKQCRRSMRIWALDFRKQTDPDRRNICLTTAEIFRNGPCFHAPVA